MYKLKYYLSKDDLQKIAFMPPDPNQKHKSISEQFSTIAKHPVDFIGSALKGEAAGLTAGAVGGALVAAPVAALMARNPKGIWQAGKGLFKGVGSAAPTYGGRIAHHLFELGKGETVGGGVIGLGLGANKFFKKYENESIEKKSQYEYQQPQYQQPQYQQPKSNFVRNAAIGTGVVGAGLLFRKQIGKSIMGAIRGKTAPASVNAAETVAHPKVISWNPSMSKSHTSKITGRNINEEPIGSSSVKKDIRSQWYHRGGSFR